MCYSGHLPSLDLLIFSLQTPARDILSAPRSQALTPEALASVGILLGHFLICAVDHGLCSPSHAADGGAEGCVLIFSCENSKAATNKK